MDVLIVEDEHLLAMELAERLLHLDNEIKIVGQTDSVSSTIDWLQQNSCDLIFLDIHLNDGVSFSIFEKIEVECPVIFTTAYDKYAIKAFEVNSIAYLLKPISERDLENSINKYKKITNLFSADVKILLDYLKKTSNRDKKFINRMMLSSGKTQMVVNVKDIAYFMADGRYLFAILQTGEKYFCESTLTRLEEELDTDSFFRINRRFMVNFSSVAYFTPYSKSRVKVKLKPQPDEDIIISSDRVKEFKQWLLK
ncbi:LytTR family DNA-binding domain-containing protein [uncultured Bacteroides sp.]|uniref:LytR/AlgR family response regulator transcription factor n=1 Tax=uncultured Bacteroides sp. TaxID=162156 RepID=UPI002AAB5856|nr:LytTR family DNA-binding domain-containing protein [uncultured Bacteroides sp.]